MEHAPQEHVNYAGLGLDYLARGKETPNLKEMVVVYRILTFLLHSVVAHTSPALVDA
jgi:hypothetical protein